MLAIVNIHQAKTHLSRLLERVRAGEEIILAKAGKPCARLCPLENTHPRKPGLFKGSVGMEACDPLRDDELTNWYS